MLLGIGALAGLGFYYNSKVNKALNNIERAPLQPPVKELPPHDPRQGSSLNILLLGSDASDDGASRSDSIIVLHIPSNRETAYLISVPRDIPVDIDGHSRQKINAAYSLGGAPLVSQTVSNLLGVPMDYVVLVDFEGFTNVIDTIGDVTIENPHEGCDTGQGVCWEEGPVTLNKDNALLYVRWRKGLPRGDLDRGLNQQRVLMAIGEKMISSNILADPSKFTRTLDALSEHITVDESFSASTIKGLAYSMRNASQFGTIMYPISGFSTDPKLGAINNINKHYEELLKEAIQTDTLSEYSELTGNKIILPE